MIRSLRRYVRTRMSRRLFVLFVLCAFLPLAAIAVLSMVQVRSLLQQQGDQRLLSTAKAYGMTLFERLLLAHELALAAAAKGGPIGPEAMEGKAFSALGVVMPDGTRQQLIGHTDPPPLAPDALERLSAGKPVVRVTGGAANPTIELIGALPGRDGFVVGKVRPVFVWGPADELPTATDFCVVEERWRTPMYCSTPMPEALRGETSWTRQGEVHRARSWTQFMRAGFGTPDWIVVASQPESYHLARAVEFARLYIPIVLMALLLVLWLTIRQSRDITEPLARLADRAQRVSHNDFETRLDLRRDDEFGSLANAFDHMTLMLGRQFASLTALSEIDRLILSTQDTTDVIRTVLQRLRDLSHASCVSLTVYDHDDPGHARSYFLSEEDADGPRMQRHEMEAPDRATLEQMAEAAWIALEPEQVQQPYYLGYVRSRGMSRALVQPIVWRGAVCGAIVVGYGTHAQPSPEERSGIRELADRMAVAVSSAWRDQQLYVQSHYDPVTGAPNRLLFKDRLNLEIVRSQREGLYFALLFVDLDHFKNVNDSYGHSAGDAVLREAAERIGACIRASDSIARLGGDEFTVLLTSLGHPQEAWLIAESIVAALSREFVMGEQRCFLSASVGIASYPADGTTGEELLKSADTAMYRAKAGGRGQAVFFEERMNDEAVARVSLDRDLRVALERGELALHYQPQWDMRSGRIVACEALVRWNHPTRGSISPGRFIALAEESGFIEPLGQWIIAQACAQMKRWREEGLPLERVSVNVSPRQFRRRGLVEFIRRTVELEGLPAACIELEITEGLLLDRGAAVEGLLRELAEMGHRIALDDFGTGFSSMSYLKRFPVHTIKIDRAFIEGLDRSHDSEPIVAAIIAMSHALGKDVIAEGVETLEQSEVLQRLLCDQAQGFLVSRALPAGEFAALVRDRAPAEAAYA
ncbi:MAG TPA: EAL domain-containing protein [Usitatibacter sp.]|nr:EAL domain-containing protein [Usitatibacter sp.]